MNRRPAAYDFVRYLAAKRTVDDRALNPHVWQAMAAAAARTDTPLHVLEIGAGIGTMVERAVAWQFCPSTNIDYTAIDAEPANIAEARARLHSLPGNWTVHLEAADLFDVVARPAALHRYDLLIANAFLDLVDIPRTLPMLRRLLKPGGLFYFTINFDGATILQPAIDPAFDAQVEAAYHRTMDERITDGRPSGDSRTLRVRPTGWCIPAAASTRPTRPISCISSSTRCMARCRVAPNLTRRNCPRGSRRATARSSRANWSTSPINWISLESVHEHRTPRSRNRCRSPP